METEQKQKIPLFIGGCGRSGTTLLGSMLGCAEEAITIPESQYIWEIGRCLGNSFDAEEVFAALGSHWRFKIWELTGISHEALLHVKTYSDLISLVVARYAEVRHNSGYRFWVDHTPESIANIGYLLSLFPDAKFIHIVRDGRGVASSILRTHWGPTNVYDAALWWRGNLAIGLAAETKFGSKKIMRVNFEDLLVKPEKTLKKICDFVGLNYSHLMLNANGFDVPEYTQRQHHLIGSALSVKRVNAWGNELTQREIQVFEIVTKELLSYLDYSQTALANHPPLKRREIYSLKAKSVFPTIAGSIKQRLKVGKLK